MHEPILIWGAGAIGGTVGAHLARKARDVTFIDVVKEHVDAIRDPKRGLSITGPVSPMTVTAPAFTPDELKGQWRRIILAVKGQHTVEACRALLPHLAEDGYVASFQNGLCERAIAGIVGEERTVGAFVNFGADWVAPGEIHFGNRAAVVVGELNGASTDRVRELHADMLLFEPESILSDDVLSYLWGKIAYSALLTAQALGNLGIADCLERPDLLELWRELAGEAIDIAHAEGVKPRGFNGFDPNAFGAGAEREAAERSVSAMVAFNRPNAKTHSGVWRDLAIRKRKTEVEGHLRPVLELARRHGLSCRRLEGLSRMIREIEDGKRPMDDTNLNELAA